VGGGATAPEDGGAAERAGRGATRSLVNALLILVSLAILVGWGAQGVYMLAPNESAVILRLGALHRIRTISGPWFHLPPPLESHVVVDTGTLRTESFGERPTRTTPGVPVDAEEGRVAEAIARAAIQTADHNVVDVSYELQYKIADPYAFSFSMADPEAVLHDATAAAMRNVIGKRDVDAVLAQDLSAIANEVETRLAQMLERYAAAVGLASAFAVERINLEKPQAPEQVREAFADVVSASQDEKRAMLAASGDASEILERARSQAAEIRERAEAYRTAKVVEARGEAARFDALRVEYEAAPEVTRQRLYLETMEAILPAMEKVIVEPDAVNLWATWPAERDARDREATPPVGAAASAAEASPR